MWPVIGGLLSGGLSAIGDIFSTNQTNQMQLQMQQQQQQYNTQMSNTAYQRASADMKAAGLNPMMMFGSGGPATSPTAPSANIKSPLTGVGADIGNSISTAMNMKQQDALINNLVAENAKIQADAVTAGMKPVTEGIVQSKLSQEATNLGVDAETKRAGLRIALNAAQQADNEITFRKTAAGQLLDQAGLLGRKVGDTLSPVTDLVSSARGIQQLFRPPQGGYWWNP